MRFLRALKESIWHVLFYFKLAGFALLAALVWKSASDRGLPKYSWEFTYYAMLSGWVIYLCFLLPIIVRALVSRSPEVRARSKRRAVILLPSIFVAAPLYWAIYYGDRQILPTRYPSFQYRSDGRVDILADLEDGSPRKFLTTMEGHFGHSLLFPLPVKGPQGYFWMNHRGGMIHDSPYRYMEFKSCRSFIFAQAHSGFFGLTNLRGDWQTEVVYDQIAQHTFESRRLEGRFSTCAWLARQDHNIYFLELRDDESLWGTWRRKRYIETTLVQSGIEEILISPQTENRFLPYRKGDKWGLLLLRSGSVQLVPTYQKIFPLSVQPRFSGHSRFNNPSSFYLTCRDDRWDLLHLPDERAPVRSVGQFTLPCNVAKQPSFTFGKDTNDYLACVSSAAGEPRCAPIENQARDFFPIAFLSAYPLP